MNESLRRFKVFQSKSRELRFSGYKTVLGMLGGNFDVNTPALEYKCVYESQVYLSDDDIKSLVFLYEIFNVNHPRDYNGRSMSVGDVVQLDEKYYFVDSIGFKELPLIPTTFSEKIAGIFAGTYNATQEERDFLLKEISALKRYNEETFWSLTKEDLRAAIKEKMDEEYDVEFDEENKVTDFCEKVGYESLEAFENDAFEHLKDNFNIDDWCDCVKVAINDWKS